MAEEVVQEPKPAAVVPPVPAQDSFLKRQLSGATFLSLEHFAHMALVVIVAGAIASGLAQLLNLWSGGGGDSLFSAAPTPIASYYGLTASAGVTGVVAALIVLVPLLWFVDRRTHAEWAKRPGYEKRLAYKLPIYGALAVLAAGKITAVITMLGVVISSLMWLGVSGQDDTGQLYMTQFVPALITALVLGATSWYVIKLAKGRDLGKKFTPMIVVVGIVVAVALIITQTIQLHTPAKQQTCDYRTGKGCTMPTMPPSSSLEDLYKY